MVPLQTNQEPVLSFWFTHWGYNIGFCSAVHTAVDFSLMRGIPSCPSVLSGQVPRNTLIDRLLLSNFLTLQT